METNPYAASPVAAGAPHSQNPGGLVAEAVISQLAGTKPWVRFFSVLTFIGAGLMLLGGVFMLIAGVAGAAMGSSGGPGSPSSMGFASGGMMVGMAVIYLLLALLYIYPGIKLWKYASRIASLMYTRAEIDLETALNEQRAFWKFAGISVIVMIALYIVAIVVIAITAGATAAKAASSM